MRQTRERISQAFWELLEEKPYNRITVQMIVDRCQVNRNTFYYHFPDIPSLVAYTVDEWCAATIARNIETGSALQCLVPLVEECVRRRRAILHLYRSAQGDLFLRGLNGCTLHTVTFYVDHAGGDLEPRAREQYIWLYRCAFYGMILDWLEHDMSYDMIDCLEKTGRLIDEHGGNLFLPHS